ncbi:hypothetical protein B7P43_G04799 [Cryptotermes secundus]|uniref:Uncharacterized protein n=1 Tax=Cryptotermes secundus TaxID=105785 RepID=A0A2J7R351_9NEOP|nr:hypothetical protein B7P43_G04799 [Cryptotermes secundus]
MNFISECSEISKPETFSDLLVAYPIVVKVVNAINLYPTDTDAIIAGNFCQL